MSLTKVNYIDKETVITAQNLNDIQDSILGLEQNETVVNNDLNSVKSKLATLEEAVPVHVSSDTPENPKVGDLWFNTAESNVEETFAVVDEAIEGNNALITSGGVFEALSSKIEIVEVWKNAAPTSSFAEQTVNIDLTDFIGIFIRFKSIASGEGQYISGPIFMDNTIIIQCTASNNVVRQRAVKPTVDGIIFQDGKQGGTEVITHSQYIIPMTIYGIKGVLV